MSSFTVPLDIRFHDVPLKDKPFELLTDFEYHVGEEGSGNVIYVPKGYRTDFASIPSFFHRVLNPIGPHGKAAVIHDWLCDEDPHSCDHRYAAKIFLEGMVVLNVKPWKRNIMYKAVLFKGPKFNAEPTRPNV